MGQGIGELKTVCHMRKTHDRPQKPHPYRGEDGQRQRRLGTAPRPTRQATTHRPHGRGGEGVRGRQTISPTA